MFQERQFNFTTPFFAAVPSVHHTINEIPPIKCPGLFTQFEEANDQFDADLSHMRFDYYFIFQP